MDSKKKILIIALVVLVAVVSIGAVSAGWFDFLGGGNNNTSNVNLSGQEVNLAAAALSLIHI